MNFGTCEHCAHSFSYTIVHNGFNDSSFAYCDACGRAAILSAYHPKLRAFKFAPGPLPRQLEAWLLPCECGGNFRASASPRCPHCNRTLSAEWATTYIERNAP